MFVIVKPEAQKYSWSYLGCSADRQGHMYSEDPEAVFVSVTDADYEMHLDHSASTVQDLMLTVRPGSESFFTRRRPMSLLQDHILEPADEECDVLVEMTDRSFRVLLMSPVVLDDPQFEFSMYGVTHNDPLEPIFSIKTQENGYEQQFPPTRENIVVWIVSPIEGIKYGVRNIS